MQRFGNHERLDATWLPFVLQVTLGAESREAIEFCKDNGIGIVQIALLSP